MISANYLINLLPKCELNIIHEAYKLPLFEETSDETIQLLREWYVKHKLWMRKHFRYVLYKGVKVPYFERLIFIQLLIFWPNSMKSKQVTPALGKLIATIYHLGSSGENPEPKLYSMTDVAFMFNRSKATIHDAVYRFTYELKEDEKTNERRISSRVEDI